MTTEQVPSKDLVSRLRGWYHNDDISTGETVLLIGEAAGEIERLRTLLDRIGVAYCKTHGTEWLTGCRGCSEAQRLTDEPPPTLTDRVPHDVAVKILRVRDLMVAKDYDEAYHVLYGIVDPTYTNFQPWEDLERAAQPPPSAPLSFNFEAGCMIGHEAIGYNGRECPLCRVAQPHGLVQALIDAAIQWRKGPPNYYATNQALRDAVDAYSSSTKEV